ncbi:hypothetical protein PS15m_011547 [Mucor circinelloides]
MPIELLRGMAVAADERSPLLFHQQGTEMGEFEKQALRQQRPVPINLQPSVGDIGTIQRKKRILNTGDAVNVGCGSHCGARASLSRNMRVVVNDEDSGVSAEVTLDHIKALRKFYDDPNAAFKSAEQAKTVAMILKRKEDILAVLPTGGGKSLLLLFTCFC